MATLWNGCFSKIDDHPVHTIPNPHHPSKMDVLPKTFFRIILDAKWLVRLSSTSPNLKGRLWPSLLFLLFMVLYSRWCEEGVAGMSWEARALSSILSVLAAQQIASITAPYMVNKLTNYTNIRNFLKCYMHIC